MRIKLWLLGGFVCISLLLACVVIFFGVSSTNKKKAVETQSLDPLVQMELNIPSVKSDANLLYGVFDSDSYQRAKAGVKMSGDLSSKLFVSKEYVGVRKFDSSPIISFMDIQYSVSSSIDGKFKYFLWFTVEGDGKKTEHFVIMEYGAGVLTSVRGY